MKLARKLTTLFVFSFLSLSLAAQDSVPRLIQFNGLHKPAAAGSAGLVQAKFAIYREEREGSPLWTETQNVQPDSDGHYSVLLGSTSNEGMPAALFLTAEPRWLEVEVGGAKQPRLLIGSVPYSLRASNADTLGGLPAAAFLRAPEAGSAAAAAGAMTTDTKIFLPGRDAASGTANCVAVFTNTTDLGCSGISQGLYSGNPAVSFGVPSSYLGAFTMVGNVPFGDAAGLALYNAGAGSGASVSIDMYNTPFNGGIPQAKIKAVDDGAYSDHLTFWTKTPGAPGNAVQERVRIASNGNVGIGTARPAQMLHVAGNVQIDGQLLGLYGASVLKTDVLYGNISLGADALNLFNTGVQNIAVGSSSMRFNTTGSYNVAVGLDALFQNATGSYNSVFGVGAMFYNVAGSDNTAIGAYALSSNRGSNNTGVGSAVLNKSTADWNTGVGAYTLSYNTTGSSNTAVGNHAMFGNLTGSKNVASGDQALYLNTTGSGNTAIGNQALQYSTIYSNNTAVGDSALSINGGSNNVAVGMSALPSLLSGDANIALGHSAGQNLASGSSNLYLYSSGPASSGGTESYTIRIGDPAVHTAAYFSGIRGVTTGAANAVPVVIDSNGQLGTVSSSRRFKKDIADMGDATSNLMRLRPVTYRYKQPYADGSEPIQYGLIAEEVAEVYPDLVAHSADGQIETVQYQVLDSMLLNEVQKLYHRNQQLEETVTRQEDEVRVLKARLARIESLLTEKRGR